LVVAFKRHKPRFPKAAEKGSHRPLALGWENINGSILRS